MAIVLLVLVYLGALGGLTLAEYAGVGPGARIVWGLAGMWVAALLQVVGAAAGRSLRHRGGAG